MNPHLLRDSIVTYLRDTDASEKELEALALFMGHSIVRTDVSTCGLHICTAVCVCVFLSVCLAVSVCLCLPVCVCVFVSNVLFIHS